LLLGSWAVLIQLVLGRSTPLLHSFSFIDILDSHSPSLFAVTSVRTLVQTTTSPPRSVLTPSMQITVLCDVTPCIVVGTGEHTPSDAEGSAFLRNVGTYISDHVASRPELHYRALQGHSRSSPAPPNYQQYRSDAHLSCSVLSVIIMSSTDQMLMSSSVQSLLIIFNNLGNLLCRYLPKQTRAFAGVTFHRASTLSLALS
jgi:hypothetical protein